VAAFAGVPASDQARKAGRDVPELRDAASRDYVPVMERPER
jgi:hypothetical protein